MVSIVNSNADVMRSLAALTANSGAAQGLCEVLRSNLGPNGAMKMLIGGAGQMKITKDGSVLLHEMQIQHPTASMIARAATAQDDETGDGTTSIVLLIAEIMKLSHRLVLEGVHPRVLSEGLDIGRMEAMTFLETRAKRELPTKPAELSRLIRDVAYSSLRTKLTADLAHLFTDIVASAIETVSIRRPIDLHMVEIMTVKERLCTDSRFVKGLVLDHGSRHADMPTSLRNCFTLVLNVSLEYEKTEVNSGFFYKSAEEREKLVVSERKFTDDKVQKIIALKRKVCSGDRKDWGFVVLNMKGIDPASLDMMAREGNMVALRRVKRRNLERLTLACGGEVANSVDDLKETDLGFAGHVHETKLGDDKFTYVEDVQGHGVFGNSSAEKKVGACTILIKGSNDHSVAQMKDAVRDGLRAVRNAIEDGCVVPGAGAFELACYEHLMNAARNTKGKARLGVEVLAEAMLCVPKALAENSGFDVQDVLISLKEAAQQSGASNTGPAPMVGLDITTGKPVSPVDLAIFDNYCVKKNVLTIAPILAEQLLLVDEVIRAGRQMKSGG